MKRRKFLAALIGLPALPKVVELVSTSPVPDKYVYVICGSYLNALNWKKKENEKAFTTEVELRLQKKIQDEMNDQMLYRLKSSSLVN